MSVRPYRSYTSAVRWRGKGFVSKRGFFHSRGAWRARNFYKRTFRRHTEQEEDDDDDPPQICDEVGADDDDTDEVETKDKDADDKGSKKDEDDDDEEKQKEEPSVEDTADQKEEKKSQDAEADVKEKKNEKPSEETSPATAKDDIEDMMLSGEWEVMDETDEEDDESSRKRSEKLAPFALGVELGVPEIADRLKEITDPLVGLEYIVEIKNELDVTYYSCLLCRRPGRIAALLRHLNYIEHKMRYLEKHLEECAAAFPRGNPTIFKHEYLVAMEKLCALLGESNERRETLLVTTKEFYLQKMRALAFRAEQLPHMTFKEDAWKKVFEDLGLPTKQPRRRARRSRSRDRDRRSRSHDRERRSRSRDRYRDSYRDYHRDSYRDSYRDHYHDRGDSYSYGRRGRSRGRYGDYVPYHQYNSYYRNDWGNERGGYGNRTPYYYYDDRSWNDYRSQGYYHQRDDDSRYEEYEHRGRSSYKRYHHEKESRNSSSHHESGTVDSIHSVGSSSARESGAIYATTIKKRPAVSEKPPAAAKKVVVKKTSAADVKKLWDKLTKPEEHKKKEDEEAKSFWDQWLDVHEEDDANSKGSNEVTVIDQVSSTAGARKEVNSDLNSVAEMLDKNLTQLMKNYDPSSGPMFPAYSSGNAGSDKVILAQKIAKALTTMGMAKIPQETLILILQQLGILPGGHTRSHQNSRAMDNLRKTIVKFDSVSRSFSR